jgi:hypothetical protein
MPGPMASGFSMDDASRWPGGGGGRHAQHSCSQTQECLFDGLNCFFRSVCARYGGLRAQPSAEPELCSCHPACGYAWWHRGYGTSFSTIIRGCEKQASSRGRPGVRFRPAASGALRAVLCFFRFMCQEHNLLSCCSGGHKPPSLPGSGAAATLPLATAIPSAWLAAPAVPAPLDGPVVTINDRRVRLGTPTAAEQPSLYKLCRQWVHNDPDLGDPMPEVG